MNSKLISPIYNIIRTLFDKGGLSTCYTKYVINQKNPCYVHAYESVYGKPGAWCKVF